MKWIEMIRVRSSEAALSAAMPEVEVQVNEMKQVRADAEMFLLKHALYAGDLAVAVVWRTPERPHKTREGLMVAERLQKLGSVDHAVWLPAEPQVVP